MKYNKRLFILAILMMVLSMLISSFTLWYFIVNKNNIANNLELSLREKIANISPQNQLVSKDDLKLALAEYCDEHNNCRGQDGASIPGPRGFIGAMGIPGPKGDSIIGPRGPEPTSEQIAAAIINYCLVNDCKGDTGETGAPGRTLEQRCVVVSQNKRRIEQKYADVETWEILYYLSPNQRCAEEE